MNCQQICKISRKKGLTEVKIFQKVLGGGLLFETPCRRWTPILGSLLYPKTRHRCVTWGSISDISVRSAQSETRSDPVAQWNMTARSAATFYSSQCCTGRSMYRWLVKYLKFSIFYHTFSERMSDKCNGGGIILPCATFSSLVMAGFTSAWSRSRHGLHGLALAWHAVSVKQPWTVLCHWQTATFAVCQQASRNTTHCLQVKPPSDNTPTSYPPPLLP